MWLLEGRGLLLCNWIVRFVHCCAVSSVLLITLYFDLFFFFSDELMKLNLLIYACSVCKKYTFDPQQSSNHARTAHSGKVAIMLMTPLPNIKLPKPASTQEQQELVAPPPTKVMSPAAEPNKTMYECEKCDRHFDRERQMNMHRCLEPSRRKSSPRRGEEGTAPKSPGRAGDVVQPKSPRRGGGEDKKKNSEMQSSPAKLVIAQEEVTSSDETKENGAGDGRDLEAKAPVVNATTRPQKTGDTPTKVGSSVDIPIEDDDADDGVPPTLGVHLSKSISVVDRRGTWKLCKRKDVSGWKWEAQKVSEDEVKQKADDKKEKSEAEKLDDKKFQKVDDKKAEKVDNQVSSPDPVLGDDDDDYEFGEDDYIEDDENVIEPFIRKPLLDDKADPNSVFSKYKILSAELEDDMIKQWTDREPPTPDEINKYIKVVHGGLQSHNGEALEFYLCLICRKVFKTKNVMTPHIFCHIGYRPYVCEQCGYSATNYGAWKVHKQKHADNELKCWHGQCAYVGKVKEDLDEHRQAHAPALRCALCDVKFKGQSTILGHLYISHHEEIKEGIGKDFYTKMATAGRARSQIVLFECNICGQKCKTKGSYYTHIRTNHALNSSQTKGEEHKASSGRKRKRGKYVKKPATILKCVMCGFICDGEKKLKHHLNSHPFIYRCCMCEDKFLTYGALNEHVGSHRGEEEGEFNPQEKINESLRRSIYLAGQMDKALEADKVQWAQRRTGAAAPKSAMTGSIFDELMSKISIPTENVSQEELEEVGEAFMGLKYKRLTPSILRYIHLRFGNVECGVCGKLFPKVGLCKDHTKKHTKMKEFKCTKCDFQGANKKAIERHLAKIHNEGESFHCPTCDTSIIGGDMYRHHMRRHAKENKGPYTCTWCNTVEEKREDMKNHIMNTHPMMPLAESTKIMGQGVVIHREKGAPFLVCEVCNETFRRICDLRRHMWKHSSVKRFTCDLCDYGSDKRGNILSHMRRHSTEKQATCHVCGKMYKTMQSLKLHVRSAHLKLKPFKCEQCDYAAAQPVHLRRHVVLHHNTGERRRFRCAICPDYKATDLQVVKRHYKKKHPKEKMNISKCCPLDAQNPSMMKKDKHQVIQVVPSLPTQTETPANPETPAPSDATQEMDQEQMNQSQDMESAIVEVHTEQQQQQMSQDMTVEVHTDQQQQQISQDMTVEVHTEQQQQISQDMTVEIHTDQQQQQLSQDMTVEVVLPEDQSQLIDINSALPDVINALAALQDSEINMTISRPTTD